MRGIDNFCNPDFADDAQIVNREKAITKPQVTSATARGGARRQSHLVCLERANETNLLYLALIDIAGSSGPSKILSDEIDDDTTWKATRLGDWLSHPSRANADAASRTAIF
jgi:hypothetical protein